MATIKVFSADGVQELKCFDTLDNVPFEPYEELVEETIEEVPVRNPFA